MNPKRPLAPVCCQRVYSPMKHIVERALSAYLCTVNEPAYERDRTKKVLFCVANDLMFRFANDAWLLFSRRNEYKVFLCSPVSFTTNYACYRLFRRLRQISAEYGYTYVPSVFAKTKQWDLVVFAEPSRVFEEFALSIPKVLTNHANATLKRYDGYLYPYLPSALIGDDGHCGFSSIFEASETTKSEIVETLPMLSPLIDVVGSPQIDRLLEKNTHRAEIRTAFGFDNSDFVVLVQSTFRECLIEDMGHELLQECDRLASSMGYKFIISLHPNSWSGAHAAKHPWGQRALQYASDSIRIRGPQEDGDLSMIASDMVLTDHTSLCINYAFLNKPMLFYLPKRGNQATDVLEPLLNICPQLNHVSELSDHMLEAQRRHNPQELQRVTDRFVSHRGQAVERINEVFDRILA